VGSKPLDSQNGKKLFDGDARVPEDAAKRAKRNFGVEWNGDGQTLLVGGMPEPDVAPFCRTAT